MFHQSIPIKNKKLVTKNGSQLRNSDSNSQQVEFDNDTLSLLQIRYRNFTNQQSLISSYQNWKHTNKFKINFEFCQNCYPSETRNQDNPDNPDNQDNLDNQDDQDKRR